NSSLSRCHSTSLVIHAVRIGSRLSTSTTPSQIYTLSLHDALPISTAATRSRAAVSIWCGVTSLCTSVLWSLGCSTRFASSAAGRSEEHTSELQSHLNLVCRLLLEKKKDAIYNMPVQHRQLWVHRRK